MQKVVVTGFEPFNGDTINPSLEAVKALPSTIAGAQIVVREMPTSFEACAQALEACMTVEDPDLVLCVGQAGGVASLMVERVAINLIDAPIPDNTHSQPIDIPVRSDGPAAYFATLPVKAMVAAMREAGVPAALSYSAGTYVCNCLMYTLLYLADHATKPIKAGFVHVPFSPAQGVNRSDSTPTMEVACIARGLEAGIAAALATEKDSHLFMGALN